MKEELESAYNKEKDGEAKARVLLVLRVKGDGLRPAHAARELHRTRAWASKWLQRFQTQGLDGLKTRQRSGRPPKIPAHIQLRLKRKLTKQPEGWRVSEVHELIRRESSITLSLRQVYRLLHKWRFRPVVPQRRFLSKAPTAERLAFKKAPVAYSATSPKASRSHPWMNP